jgi:ubiquinone/menaquinone biosynthesis C-methylase UbiE
MTSENKINIAEKNREAWNDFYSLSPRLRYPDLVFIHFLMRYFPKLNTGKGLSIGSGDGAHAFAIANLGLAVDCVDLSETSLMRIKKFSLDDGIEDRINVHHGDQRALSFLADASYDIVESWSVISYGTKTDSRQSLAEIYRVLKPGGSFIGLLESTIHTAYQQSGVKMIEPGTYQMPNEVTESKPNVILSYYTEPEVRQALSNFEELSLAHRVFELPPDMSRKVGQWMFYCKKPL